MVIKPNRLSEKIRHNRGVTRFRLSLLELILSLVVVVLGIVGLIGVFPVGLGHHQRAIGTSQAMDAATQFLHYNASQINEDWSFLDAFPTTKPGSDESNITWTTSSLIDNDHINIKWPKTGPDEVFDSGTDSAGMFLLEQTGKDADGAAFVEFGAVLRLWQSEYESFSDGSARVRLCCEVSFPVAKSYEARVNDGNVEVFCLEMFKSPDGLVQTASSPCAGTPVYYPSLSEDFEVTACCPYTEISENKPGATSDIINLTYHWTDGTSTTFTDLNQMYGRWDALGNWITEGKSLNRTSDVDPGTDWEEFVLENTCSVLIRATPELGGSDGGGVFPSGVMPALKNGSRSFTITADDEYEIADVVVDGESVGPIPGGTTSYVHTFSNVGTINHSLVATFTYVGSHAPIANPDIYTTNENENLMIIAPSLLLLANDTDADPIDSISVDNPGDIELSAGEGAVSVFSTGEFTYAPQEGWTGTATFSYKVIDSRGLYSSDTLVTINVIAANTPPVADDDSANTSRDTDVVIDVLDGDYDPNDDEIFISGVDTTGCSGTVAIAEDSKTVTFSPSPGFYGVTEFTYNLVDSTGVTSTSSGSVTVNVSAASGADGPCPGNFPPVFPYDVVTYAADVGVAMSKPLHVTKRASDGNGDDITYTLTGPAWVSLIMEGTKPWFVGTPAESDGGKWNEFELTASDGCESSSLSVKIFVSSDTQNNCPRWKLETCTSIGTKQVSKYFCHSLPFPCTWLDEDNADEDLTFELTYVTQGGEWMTWNNKNQIIGTPTAAGTFLYEIEVSDGECSDTAVIEIEVDDPNNETPSAVSDSYTMPQRGFLAEATPGVLANDSDPDGPNALMAALTSPSPSNGTLTFNSDGSFSFLPNKSFVGTETFTYRISDGAAESGDATVTIVVEAAANNAPVANPDAYSAKKNETLVVLASSGNGLLANDTDSNGGDSLVVGNYSDPSSGSLGVLTDGSLTFTPAEDFVGAVTFTYQASDGTDAGNIGLVTITVGEPAADADPDEEKGDAGGAAAGGENCDVGMSVAFATGGGAIIDACCNVLSGVADVDIIGIKVQFTEGDHSGWVTPAEPRIINYTLPEGKSTSKFRLKKSDGTVSYYIYKKTSCN